MAKERIKNVTIPIYNQETLDRLMQHFPEAYSREETLSRLLDTYDQKDDQQDTALLVQKLFALLPTDYHEDSTDVQKLTTAVEHFTTDYQKLLHDYQKLTTEVQKLFTLLPTDYYGDSTDVQNLTTAVERFTTDLQNKVTELTTTVQNLTTDVQNKQETVQKLMDKQVSETAIVINAPAWSRALLLETARRLSERYGQSVTPEMILLDMFNRYTIERWSQWFYPFVLEDRDIEAASGLDMRTLKSYLKSK